MKPPKSSPWLVVGICLIATITGFMVGASQSPVISVAMPAVFGLIVTALGFFGSSTIEKKLEPVKEALGKNNLEEAQNVLSSIEREIKSNPEILGKILVAFSICYAIGMASGWYARRKNALSHPSRELPWVYGRNTQTPPTISSALDWINWQENLSNLGYTPDQIHAIYEIQLAEWRNRQQQLPEPPPPTPAQQQQPQYYPFGQAQCVNPCGLSVRTQSNGTSRNSGVTKQFPTATPIPTRSEVAIVSPTPTPPVLSSPTPTPPILATPTPVPPVIAEASIFTRFGNIPRDDVRAMVDNYATALQENPGAQGYIIAYGRRGNAVEAQRRAKFVKDYLVETRGIDAGRLVTVDGGGFKEEAMTELWIVPAGATPPSPTPTVSAIQSQRIANPTATRFIEGAARTNRSSALTG